MKKIFKKYGKIEEFSWKGKYFFIVINDVFIFYRLIRIKMKQKRLSEK